jgi:heptosyltransferase-1
LSARFYQQRFEVPRNLHAVERNRQLAALAANYSLDGLPLDYGVIAPPLVADWLNRPDYAVLLTATSRDDKLWPEIDWLALGSALIAMGLTCVLPAGTPVERQRADRLAKALGRAIAAPPLGIPDLAALLAGARIAIGVDTGLIHLAAALGRPTLALFAGSDPTLTGVHAGNQAVNLGTLGQPPLAGEVLDAARRLIG